MTGASAVARAGHNSLLEMNMFKPHITENATKHLARSNIDMAVIPEGRTALVRPLDGFLKKPFKDCVHEL
jgi:hypothetical protein